MKWSSHYSEWQMDSPLVWVKYAIHHGWWYLFRSQIPKSSSVSTHRITRCHQLPSGDNTTTPEECWCTILSSICNKLNSNGIEISWDTMEEDLTKVITTRAVLPEKHFFTILANTIFWTGRKFYGGLGIGTNLFLSPNVLNVVTSLISMSVGLVPLGKNQTGRTVNALYEFCSVGWVISTKEKPQDWDYSYNEISMSPPPLRRYVSWFIAFYYSSMWTQAAASYLFDTPCLQSVFTIKYCGYLCLEIDCGDPEAKGAIPGFISSPTSTVFNSTFEFRCADNFTLEGASDFLQTQTVTCRADHTSFVDPYLYIAGYWDLGDLRCEGNVYLLLFIVMYFVLFSHQYEDLRAQTQY